MSHSSPILPLYHETLWSAVEAAVKFGNDSQVEFDAEKIEEVFQFGGLNYDCHKEAHAEISLIKGKRTRKFFHVTIWRLSSGTYEVNTYIL